MPLWLLLTRKLGLRTDVIHLIKHDKGSEKQLKHSTTCRLDVQNDSENPTGVEVKPLFQKLLLWSSTKELYLLQDLFSSFSQRLAGPAESTGSHQIRRCAVLLVKLTTCAKK